MLYIFLSFMLKLSVNLSHYSLISVEFWRIEEKNLNHFWNLVAKGEKGVPHSLRPQRWQYLWSVELKANLTTVSSIWDDRRNSEWGGGRKQRKKIELKNLRIYLEQNWDSSLSLSLLKGQFLWKIIFIHQVSGYYMYHKLED